MLKQRLLQIEKEIQNVLPDIADKSWIESLCGSFQSQDEFTTVDMFCEPARDLLRRGGKRWRPLLLVLLAEIYGGTEANEVSYGLTPVVELAHNGSLIIDDIEDGSDMRRGEPAVHTTYGTDISINAGNLLYFLPTICIDQADISGERKLKIYQIYSKYLRRVHFGQGLDISWHRRTSYFPNDAAYRLMCRLKTGCLAGMAAEIGAAVGGAQESKIAAVGKLAEELGIAFQIMDDVVNLERGNPGKMKGDDIIEGKKSLPIILFAQYQPQNIGKLASLLEQARMLTAADESAQPLIDEVIESVQESGALQQARETAELLYNQVFQSLKEILPECGARDELFELLNGMK